MTGLKVEVEGLTTFESTLNHAADSLDEIAPAEAGRLVQSRASSLAPKMTGALSRSIQATTEGNEVVVGSGLVYAGVQESGWPGHNIEAQPYLRPGLEQSTDQVLNAY